MTDPLTTSLADDGAASSSAVARRRACRDGAHAQLTSVTLRSRRMEAGAPGRQIRLAGLGPGRTRSFSPAALDGAGQPPRHRHSGKPRPADPRPERPGTREARALHGGSAARRLRRAAREVTEIKKKLLDAQGEPVAITAALRGAGGFGKTALANALCHDPEIEDAFSDGILRVVLGEKPEDLVGRIAELIEIVTGERPGVTHHGGGQGEARRSLDDRRCLLVIDDAWREQDLAPFLHRGPRDQTTRLITTRDDACCLRKPRAWPSTR